MLGGNVEPGLELGKHPHRELEGDDIGVVVKGVPATHGENSRRGDYREQSDCDGYDSLQR